MKILKTSIDELDENIIDDDSDDISTNSNINKVIDIMDWELIFLIMMRLEECLKLKKEVS